MLMFDLSQKCKIVVTKKLFCNSVALDLYERFEKGFEVVKIFKIPEFERGWDKLRKTMYSIRKS